MARYADVRAGMWDTVPALPAAIPFGFVVGAAAVQAGFSATQAVAMSAFVFGGASQLAAIDLVNAGAPLAVVVLTAMVVNTRYVMYSAAIAPHFRRIAERSRLVLSQFIVDSTFAIAVTEYERDQQTDRRAYFLGVVVVTYGGWMAGSVAGVLVGNRVPEALQLDFAVPLLFLALLVPSITDEPTGVAAAIGGVAAVVGVGVPMNLGIVVAGLAGVLAGSVAEAIGVGR